MFTWGGGMHYNEQLQNSFFSSCLSVLGFALSLSV